MGLGGSTDSEAPLSTCTGVKENEIQIEKQVSYLGLPEGRGSKWLSAASEELGRAQATMIGTREREDSTEERTIRA